MQTLPKKSPQWYVLTTRPRQEKQISKRLSANAIEHFLPLQRQLRCWHDRKKWVEIPLFNSYIFVKTEEKYRSKVFQVEGLVKYVSIAGKICVLTEDEIERVRRLCSYIEPVNIEQGDFYSGEEVEIMEGHFIGMKGRLLSNADRPQLKLAIESLGCFATVFIDKKFVRKLQS